MLKEQEVPFFYLSARAYAKQTGIGEAEVKKQLIKKELDGFVTEGQYKIKVFKDGGVPREQYEKVTQENAVMKTLIKHFIQTGSEVIEKE